MEGDIQFWVVATHCRKHDLTLFQKELNTAYRNYKEEAYIQVGSLPPRPVLKSLLSPQEFFRYLS